MITALARSLLLSLFLVIYASSASYSLLAQEELPNILWITSEDNSPFLGCYGDTYATTPNLDRLAEQGILYENAFATAPVCAPARSSLITGVYPPSMGTQHMRSRNDIPERIRFYPAFLKDKGYYCTNNSKTDYNIGNVQDVWDESSREATYRNRAEGQPFFAIFNLTVSHESSIHQSIPSDELRHDPDKAPVPPYHPATPEMRHDWAQYYDKVEDMDTQVGEILARLEADGLADNTIVFYYSDHGGILGRSKRYLFESGLRVPLIIRFPEKYRHLAPGDPGTRLDRIVSFIDFPPTLLSLAGIPKPGFMQGKVFLGPYDEEERDYAYSFRGRMDEVIDMSRSIRDKRYRYTFNYMPHRMYGQYLEYLWRAPSMPSWEAAYAAGSCNPAQSAFWEPKPVEELYDTWVDPHNIYNLADDPHFAEVLGRMRKAARDWSLEIRDAGFLAEAEMKMRARTGTIYDYVHGPDYHLEAILEAAQLAAGASQKDLPELERLAGHDDPGVRYWAATGLAILKEKSAPAQNTLEALSQDPAPNVAIAAGEGLYYLGETEKALSVLVRSLDHPELMVRVHALNILRLMGPDATPALPQIEDMVEGLDAEANDYDWRAGNFVVEQLKAGN